MMKTLQKKDITGIVMPHNWDEDGKIIQIAIYTNKEEVYLVEHNHLAQELLKLINRRVEVKGRKRVRMDGNKYIAVHNYIVLEEITDDLNGMPT